MDQSERERRWVFLAGAALSVRQMLHEDNGGKDDIDPEDPFLGEAIIKMDEIITYTGVGIMPPEEVTRMVHDLEEVDRVFTPEYLAQKFRELLKQLDIEEQK